MLFWQIENNCKKNRMWGTSLCWVLKWGIHRWKKWNVLNFSTMLSVHTLNYTPLCFQLFMLLVWSPVIGHSNVMLNCISPKVKSTSIIKPHLLLEHPVAHTTAAKHTTPFMYRLNKQETTWLISFIWTSDSRQDLLYPPASSRKTKLGL